MKSKYLKGPCQQCGGRLEFPAEMVGTSIQCPHCQQPTELMLASPPVEPAVPRSAVFWATLAAVILVFGLAGSLVALKRAQNLAARQKLSAKAAASSRHASAAAEGELGSEVGFQVSAIVLEKTEGSSLVYAVGTLTNDSNRQRFGVKLDLDLLDSTSRKIGTAKDYQSLIEPRAVWRFRALVIDTRAASAKLASVTEEN